MDEYCLELYPQYSRNVIQSWITQVTQKKIPNFVGQIQAISTQIWSSSNVIEHKATCMYALFQGKVLVNDVPLTKAGSPVPKDAAIRIKAEAIFITREHAKIT